MVAQISGKGLRLNTFGLTVSRAAAVLPATTTATIFNVTGRVIVTNILGEVTTVMSATATTLALNFLSTPAGTNADIGAAVAVTSLAVGSFYAAPTVGSTAVVGPMVVQNNEFILNTGIIRITTSATNTGAMSWYVNYVPLTDGSSITAA
jgi:hypothetical protein